MKLYRNPKIDEALAGYRSSEPPNLFAAILDPQFFDISPKENEKIWITCLLDDRLVSGSLERYSVKVQPREIELKNVVYYFNNSDDSVPLPEDVSVVIRVDDVQIVEVKHITV